MGKISNRILAMDLGFEARSLGANLIDLPISSGDWYVNPAFVMSVQAISASTTEVIVAGKGAQTVQLSLSATLARLAGS